MQNLRAWGYLLVAFFLLAAPAPAQEVCALVDTSTETVKSDPDVVLQWGSSFLCSEAPSNGAFRFTFTVANMPASALAVTIEDIQLRLATPRGRLGVAQGSITGKTGFNVTFNPNEARLFTVDGNYTLGKTDEGEKANLHFQVRGRDAYGRVFFLGVNVHLRGPGAVE